MGRFGTPPLKGEHPVFLLSNPCKQTERLLGSTQCNCFRKSNCNNLANIVATFLVPEWFWIFKIFLTVLNPFIPADHTNTFANSADLDETANHEPSHQIYTFCRSD